MTREKYFFMKLDRFRKLSCELSKDTFSRDILNSNRYNYGNWLDRYVVREKSCAEVGLLDNNNYMIVKVVKKLIDSNFTKSSANVLNLYTIDEIQDAKKIPDSLLMYLLEVTPLTLNNYKKGSYFITDCCTLIQVTRKFDAGLVRDPFKILKEFYFDSKLHIKDLLIDKINRSF